MSEPEKLPDRIEIILRKPEEPSTPSFWDKAEKPAKVFALIALPVIVGAGGWLVQSSIANETVSKDYVELALSLLDKSQQVEPELRSWAVDLLNSKAPLKFSTEVSSKLASGVYHLPGSLEGRDITVRNRPTNLTRIIADGFLRAAPGAELAIFNSGSIRIDSTIPTDALSLATIDRVLPFGGIILTVEMRGSLLRRVLDQGKLNQDTGGFLQTANVTDDDGWFIDEKPLEFDRYYQVAINDFLVSGRELGLEFLNRNNPELQVISEHGSFKDGLINELLSRVVITP